MTVKEFRIAHNLSQGDMVDLLKPSVPWLTRPVFSLYERGAIQSGELSACIQALIAPENDFSTVVEEIPNKEVKTLKTEFRGSRIYRILEASEEPVTRTQLMRMTGMGDREIRRKIRELRNAGANIMSSSSTAGYWLSDSEYDRLRFDAEMKSRARAAYIAAANVRKNNPEQITME